MKHLLRPVFLCFMISFKVKSKKEGIASYSKFVNLMVNYYKDNPL
jgi:hypothetical protein